MQEITTVAGWKALLEASEQGPVLVLKHSTRCPVSASAYDTFRRFLERQPEKAQGAYVKIVENRGVSNAMAEDTGICHASPQVYLLVKGRACWNASHYGITEEALAEAVSKAEQGARHR